MVVVIVGCEIPQTIRGVIYTPVTTEGAKPGQGIFGTFLISVVSLSVMKAVLITILFLSVNVAHGQSNDSCLEMALPNDSAYGILYNPDSVMRDTCSGSYYGHYFIKR